MELTLSEIKYIRNLIWTEDCRGGVVEIHNGVNARELEERMALWIKDNGKHSTDSAMNL